MFHQKKPAWWRLYLDIALVVALLFVEEPLPVTPGWHKLLQLVLVVVLTWLMAAWTWRNTVALDDEPLLREVKQRAAARHVALTPVQTRYLVAQEHQTRTQRHGTY